jgi:hypothetical protein
VEDLTQIAETVQSVATVVGPLLVTGVGGVVMAWKKIRQEMHKDDHTTALTSLDNLQTKLQQVETAITSERKDRSLQHETNTERLDVLQTDVQGLREDVSEIRTLVEKMLGKMAGIH